MSDVLWRRLRYMLTPQWDIYNSIAKRMLDTSILDVGFGTGLGTLLLAANNPDSLVYGLEIDQDAVDFANKVFPLPGIYWEQGDITQQKVAPVYGTVVMVEVLEHIENWQLALENVAGMLRDAPLGGRLYISSRNANADLRRNDLHEREVTAAEFKAMLSGYFSDVKLYDYTLEAEQGDDSRVTPLVAVCTK